jgi:hypothetical protein
MFRGYAENGTEIVLPESFVADQVGDVVDRLRRLSQLLNSVRQREAANEAADLAEYLHLYAQRIDVAYVVRQKNYHAIAMERMMQD